MAWGYWHKHCVWPWKWLMMTWAFCMARCQWCAPSKARCCWYEPSALTCVKNIPQVWPSIDDMSPVRSSLTNYICALYFGEMNPHSLKVNFWTLKVEKGNDSILMFAFHQSQFLCIKLCWARILFWHFDIILVKKSILQTRHFDIKGPNFDEIVSLVKANRTPYTSL